MSTRGWKECRRRGTFPMTRSLGTNRVPFCTLKDIFGKFDPLMETVLEYETMCRELARGHVFVESLAEINPRKVAEVVRRLHHIRSDRYNIQRSPIKMLVFSADMICSRPSSWRASQAPTIN